MIHEVWIQRNSCYINLGEAGLVMMPFSHLSIGVQILNVWVKKGTHYMLSISETCTWLFLFTSWDLHFKISETQSDIGGLFLAQDIFSRGPDMIILKMNLLI